MISNEERKTIRQSVEDSLAAFISRIKAINRFFYNPTEELDGLEILCRRADYDLINIDIGWLLDGKGNSASDGFGRNGQSLVSLGDHF